MDPIRTQLLAGLEKELNMKIPIQTGAAILKINNQKLWIEFDEGKEYVCVHFLIDERLEGRQLTIKQLESLAYLNGRCEVLGSGSIGIHQQTQKLHYFCSIPLILAHPEIVLGVIAIVPSLKKAAKEALCLT